LFAILKEIACPSGSRGDASVLAAKPSVPYIKSGKSVDI